MPDSRRVCSSDLKTLASLVPTTWKMKVKLSEFLSEFRGFYNLRLSVKVSIILLISYSHVTLINMINNQYDIRVQVKMNLYFKLNTFIKICPKCFAMWCYFQRSSVCSRFRIRFQLSSSWVQLFFYLYSIELIL